MPIAHRVYHRQRLVLATASGVLSDADVFTYQREVWSDPAVHGYNELVDMGEVVKIALPSEERVRDLANLSASMDPPASSSKFAIVALDNLAYGLGQMYGARRDMNAKSTKQVEVFRTRREAFEWLGVEEAELDERNAG